MVATLPKGADAARSTQGRTQHHWSRAAPSCSGTWFLPPIGDFQQSVQMLVSGGPLESQACRCR